MSATLFAGLTGLARLPAAPDPDAPLVVAVHGGTYTSRYFDVPGHSLLDRAEANDIPILAIDRPGHGGSALLAPDQSDIAGQARFLAGALEEAWAKFGAGRKGMVIIAHSIGAAISLRVAGAHGGLPLLGIAVSGVGLRTPPGHREMWNDLPNLPHVDLPVPLKDEVMFGPAGSFDPAMPAASHVANAPAVRAELVDIVSTWQDHVREVLARISVPLHYRQAEVDKLWIVDEGEVAGFAQAAHASPRVDATLVRGTGHCMDFHKVGAALQLQQLGFALECAAEA